ncbi:MAG: beta-lactamase family protein [Clostridium sp.]|jgi:CubicO group peptidase (beta-lactamase class C family)|nr:beta-lactamase family protein [Clostridium sp.]
MSDYKKLMDRLIRQEIEKGEIHGASALIVHNGKEIYHKVSGYADKEAGRPMSRDTIFRLYSMTKPVTACAVMILAERGQIELWERVGKYLPGFTRQKVWKPEGGFDEARRDITIWDLLHMTSGIPYPDETHEPGRRMAEVFRSCISRRKAGERVDTQEYIRLAAEVPLVFQPGEKWMYGLSADVLGAVAEAAAGKPLGEFFREELFLPLDMPDTGFFVPKKKMPRFAGNYSWSPEENRLTPYTDSHLGEYYGEDVAFESGGAGLVSTIDDYLHFAQLLLNKGVYQGKRILGRKTVEFMTQDRLTAKQKQDFTWDSLLGHGYSCFLRILADQGAALSNAGLGEYGWDGWTGNFFTVSPADHLIILYFIQKCGSGMTPMMRKLRLAAYAMLE